MTQPGTSLPSTSRIAVIGAGVAGVTCARALSQSGLRPTVFEKSRGLGGRLSTRRTDDGRAFDHGAQYATARTPEFRDLVDGAVQAGMAAQWHPIRFDDLDPGPDAWIVGTPAMNRLVKGLADGLDVRLQTRIDAIRRDGDGWRIEAAQGQLSEVFDRIVCTTPAPQARDLLSTEPAIGSAIDRVSIAPCWTLMLAFETAPECGFEVWRSQTHDLSWIARDSSKPGRPAAGDCWVVQASPAWSAANLELDSAEIERRMVARVQGVLGAGLPPILHASAHRWRHARTLSPLGAPFHATEDRTLFLGGDWCLGARIECAHESGLAIARAVVATQDSKT